MRYSRCAELLALLCFLHFAAPLSGQDASLTASGVSNVTEKETSTAAAETLPGDDDDADDGDALGKIVYDYEDEYNPVDAPKNKTKPTTGIVYKWAKWPKWNKCSRLCGGGVQARIRNCIEKRQTASGPLITEFQPETDGVIGCYGVVKKFRMCNLKPCAKTEDFRNQQCAAFNTVPYKGKLYKFEAYIKENHECELNCKPVDLNYYATLSKWVTDGTPCTRPAVYYTHSYKGPAVCVEGICKAVHKSGVIRGSTTNDVKFKCGSVLCRPVSEIFAKAVLPQGYFYITTIGSGASNISIKQIASSENRLAIRSVDNRFIINGNNHISESGIYEYNGDAFEYDKEMQFIEAKGPITRSIDVLLLVHGVNPGIKYDYNIPVASAALSDSEESDTHWNEAGAPLDDFENNNILETADVQLAKAKDRKRRKFSWKLLGFGQCNRSCGAGVRSPIFRCIKDIPTRFYTPRRCMFADKPVFSEDIYKCNLQLCPAYWQTDEYGECVCTDGVGAHSRGVKCVQEQASGVVKTVDDGQCPEGKPQEKETCDCPKKIRRKIYAQRSDKSARLYSRLIGSSANVYNSFNQTLGLRKGIRDERDKTGVWLMSDWNEQCSTDCGAGLEHRSIYCDRTAPYTDVCDLRITPGLSRPCDQAKKCTQGVWFTSPWGNCTGDCFNLVRKRTVFCIIDGMIMEDDECKLDEKPSQSKNCTHRDVGYCGPKWHYSEWSECSRSCGEGVQRRYAKCLEFDWKENLLKESSNCKYTERQPVYGICNVQKCDEIDAPAGALQNDFGGPACTDELPSCKRMSKSKLCKVHYYQKNCCQTCSTQYL